MKLILVGLFFLLATSLYVPSAFGNDSDSADSDSGSDSSQPISLPEPATLGLMAIGLLGTAWIRRRK